jgi:hypothetical protein
MKRRRLIISFSQTWGKEKMKEIAIKAMKRLTPEEKARVSKALDELHTE